ncbi:cyclohexanol dehydrogenase [Cupriavidus basilensis OR16]|uniref:Cyclohexanol dehydrogenase n=1 Tax=Cupriavidus basilensis OR16 TaxID=1127483 RepID=H1RY95_9BURK|nr:SDR family oxidoreductase [Cupriavidus basilensis]EHP44586.1 cyclohexanol dehydrogenase [Cupriavidus basilensis OR16]
MEYPFNLFDLRGKVAAITGAARGIGAETARVLAAAGAKVAVLDLLEADGQAAVQRIEAEGGQAAFWKLDVSSEPEVGKVFGEIAARFGRLDVLVNNAGIDGVNAPTHELALAQWQRVMDVNVTGTFLCTKHAIPHLERAGGGSIVNVSSMYGIVGGPDVPPYHASKAAVRMMAKTDAMHPGYIRTPMLEEVAHASGQGEGLFAYLGSQAPMGRLGEPRDIAAGILYLVSDAARYVTGAELVIDGGYTAR